MATHGLGGFKRMLVGSVADKVLRAAEVPVLLFRPGEELEPSAAHTREHAVTVPWTEAEQRPVGLRSRSGSSPAPPWP